MVKKLKKPEEVLTAEKAEKSAAVISALYHRHLLTEKNMMNDDEFLEYLDVLFDCVVSLQQYANLLKEKNV